MNDNPVLLTADDLSTGWAQAYLHLTKPGNTRSGPILVSIRGDFGKGIPENPTVRAALDSYLLAVNDDVCHTVANTIFPISIWNPTKPRDELYQKYAAMLPRLRKFKGNHNGMYFERMVHYGGDANGANATNQLEHVIQTFQRGNHRASALQLAVFDPKRDHTNTRQRGFPCLQQIAIVPIGDGGFRLEAFYPLHYFVEKAYGNYLGLARLGRFLAHELGIKFVGFNCYSVTAVLNPSKESLTTLSKSVAQELAKTK